MTIEQDLRTESFVVFLTGIVGDAYSLGNLDKVSPYAPN